MTPVSVFSTEDVGERAIPDLFSSGNKDEALLDTEVSKEEMLEQIVSSAKNKLPELDSGVH